MKKKTYICLILCACSFLSVSQNTVIDSLKQELNKSISEKEKITILTELVEKTLYDNYDESISYSNEAISIAKANNLKKEEATIYKRLLRYNLNAKKYKESEQFLDKYMAIAKETNDNSMLAIGYSRHGLLYKIKKDLYNALISYDKALKIHREDNDNTLIARQLYNISTVYANAEDNDKAIESSLEAISLLEDNSIGVARSAMIASGCYSMLNKIELAKKYAKMCISIAEKEENLFFTIDGYRRLGLAYMANKEYTKALAQFNIAKEKIDAYKKESTNTRIYTKTLANYHVNMAATLYELERYDEALLNAHKAYEIVKKDNVVLTIFNASKIIAETSEKLKKYDDAISFYKTHITYKDSLVTNDYYRGQVAHELSEAAYKNEKEKEILDSKRKNTLLIVIISFLLLLTVLGLYFYKKLSKLYKAADAGNKAKSIFLTKVTHEIKTPLTSIIGFSNLLKNSSLDKEQILDFNQKIEASSNRLLKLSNKILEFSSLKQENNNILQTPQNFNTLINTIKKQYAIEAQQKGLAFKVVYNAIDNYIFFDNNRLIITLNNLLINAIKFSNSGEVSFKIDMESENKEHVNINFIIRDGGIGISEKNINKIQNEFYQIVSNQKDNVGIGLGLSIAKENLEIMNSKLDIVSVLNQGSTFSFRLKLRKGKLIEKDSNGIKLHKGSFDKPLKILIVEDNKLSALLLQKIVESFLSNVQILFAYDGLEAVDRYKADKPSIILMDLQMPNLDGFGATKLIREIQEAYIPIIACSATLFGDNIERYNGSGFDDYIEKPVNKQLLEAILLKYINLSDN